MKKAFAIVALVAAMFVAGKAQAQVSVNIGYAPEKFTTTWNNTSSSTNYQGFFVGVTDNIGLAKGLGVAPGLQFRLNTRSYEGLLGTKYKDTQMLIDVPVLLNYSIGITRDLSIAPFVGPMFSIALSGATKTGNTSVSWYGDDSSNNRFNINAVLGAAIDFNRAKLFAGYRFGLLDQDSLDSTTTKTQGFFVGLGYTF